MPFMNCRQGGVHRAVWDRLQKRISTTEMLDKLPPTLVKVRADGSAVINVGAFRHVIVSAKTMTEWRMSKEEEAPPF